MTIWVGPGPLDYSHILLQPPEKFPGGRMTVLLYQHITNPLSERCNQTAQRDWQMRQIFKAESWACMSCVWKKRASESGTNRWEMGTVT